MITTETVAESGIGVEIAIGSVIENEKITLKDAVTIAMSVQIVYEIAAVTTNIHVELKICEAVTEIDIVIGIETTIMRRGVGKDIVKGIVKGI